ncbi:bifunctional lysylphosphatidylglycerol flippase/synthetase MprF [Oceaniglobus trochenteri]|uniref:bifunctional lysylphosphatidylglycerol flippase/synthetase MprF n=1 Tax=Oceaniglobus trochenteri TaxID=2763260 RepID=UPI001CFF69A2
MSELPAGRPDTAEEQHLSVLSVLRKHAAVIVTFLLFVAGTYALYRLLAPLDLSRVMASLRAASSSSIMAAIVATVFGYLALIGYDWSALRHIGKRLPLPTIALGGFLGYAFGNTIGLSAVSGGAVRYRIYSALGLDAYDVAAIASFAALSYGIGATLIGLAALAWHPAEIVQMTALAPHVIRLWSLIAVGLGVLALVVLALRGGTLRIGRFALKAPSLGTLAAQLVFTAIEICMGTLVLHVLLPPGALPFSNLVIVYAIATMVGIASHVPGGVGVFESVVIAALPGHVPLNDAVTALLLFRLIYFLLPFLAGMAVLSVMEAWAVTGRRLRRASALTPVLAAGMGMVPLAMGFLVLASGLFMMLAGLLPNPAATAEDLESILPLAMIEGSALVSSILGAFLVVLSVSLFRKSRQAYWIVAGLLLLGIATAAFKTRDVERVVLLTVMLAILLPYRSAFGRTARIAQGLWSVQWVGMILSILFALGLTWLLVHANAAPGGVAWWQIGADMPSVTAGRAGLAAAVVLALGVLSSALRTARVRMRPPDADALNEAQRIIDAQGQGGDMLALTGDKMLMFAENSGAVLSYGVKGASWIALGAPTGGNTARTELAWAFHDAARAAGARPVFYEIPEDFIQTALDMGLSLHKMGEEAIIPLADFSLDGPERKKLRASHARASRDGLTFDLLSPPHSDALLGELAGVSDDWLALHAAREKRFSVGRFDRAWLNRWRIAVVRSQGRIVAFGNILEAQQSRSAAIDLMRHAKNAPSGSMEYLFTALMLRLKDEGGARFSMGMVPFAGLSTHPGGAKHGDLWIRFGTLIYQHGDRFYNFEGLRRFKAKFDPEWHPRYLCCRTVLPPVAPLADAARLIAGSARGIIGK